jgi:hypothetical protein
VDVIARNLVVKFLLPLPTGCTAIPLRMPVATESLLLLRTALFARVRFLLAPGLHCPRRRFSYVRLPTLAVQLGG